MSIHLRVNGPRDLEVDLIRNLEHSNRFLRPRLMSETAQAQESGRAVPVAQTGVPGGVQFDILSGYNPLPVVKSPTKLASPAVDISAAAKAGAAMGAAGKISAARVPKGTGQRPDGDNRSGMPPRNQVPQPARPPAVNGVGR